MKNFINIEDSKNIIDLHLSVLVFQEDEYYVALCPSLNLSSYGDTVNEAKLAFDEAVETYIEYGTENGTLHQDLIDNGWIFSVHDKRTVEPPSVVKLNIQAGKLRTQYNETRSVAVC